MPRKSYADQLKDPRWQKKRLEILSRDCFKCRECGSSTETLHVHHLLYRKNRCVWDYEPELLVTLCEDCHAARGEVIERLLFLQYYLTTAQLEIIVNSIGLMAHDLGGSACAERVMDDYLATLKKAAA